MECPKCHTAINERETVCPKCHKVLLLECPNCHSLEETAVCSKCGYKILVKCSKCGRINPTINDLCVKCGFPTKTSLAYQECESDEIAYAIIKFTNLKKIRRLLKSQNLYEKFLFKLKNQLFAQIKNAEGLFITYGETFVLNFNKELSFPTSSNKAVRFALKLANAFSQLNLNVIDELRVPLGLSVTIAKKSAEELQLLHTYESNVKLLNIKKDIPKYLKGTQVILDQYVWDEINKEYKTDSLYSMEENGQTTMFYEVVLDSYILPPDNNKDSNPINVMRQNIKKQTDNQDEPDDLYSFNVFDINAKCSFETTNAVSIKDKLNSMDFNKNAKVLSLSSKPEYSADISDVVEVCRKKGLRTITVTCTEAMSYEPWGFFIQLFKSFFNISYTNSNIEEKLNAQQTTLFAPLFDLCKAKPAPASSPEDARFMYIELWGKFLSILTDTVIIVDGFEYLDDTSIQTISLYIDRLRTIKPNFIFITSDKVSVHSKIKELMRTDSYTELKLVKSSFSNCLATIKSDAKDFIGSFYFEKIQENFNGSYLYFKYAMKYLMETGVLIDFENKLLVKSSKSVVVPSDISKVYKARMKNLGKNQEISFIIAYSSMLYPGLDINTLERLGIKEVSANVKALSDTELARLEDDRVIVNNYSVFNNILANAIKKEAEVMLAKNIMGTISAVLSKAALAIMMGKISAFNDEYNILCSNADFAIACGDYDTYLKNCLGFLSLIESVDSNITQENIEERKNEVYNSILKYLYSYAPTKIYFIENILLTDALNENDDDKIVRLSNMMLQGALISSNYTDALGLLHNILSRMQNPTLIVDNAVNAKFLLLSLINIEILYNIGKFKECVETATEILSVIKPEIIEKIKPAGFSINSFISHLLETMRLAAFAKLYLMDGGLENFLELIKITLDSDIEEKDSMLAIRDFLAGKVYNTGVIEEYSPFSKIIFLILQEISKLQTYGDYKQFAQNIYQAKLLAEDIYQAELKYFCDLLIAYAYSKIGIDAKAKYICNDVLNNAEKSAMFNILMIAKYFIAKIEKDPKKSLIIANDALDSIRRHNNQAAILYVLFEKLYMNIAEVNGFTSVDIESEEKKLEPYTESLKILVY